MTDWFQNDELFLAQLREGHRRAEQVAARLLSEGISVEVTPMEVRAQVEERSEFADEVDLLVGSPRAGPVDVKSRALDFQGPEDYPYETALVDTVAGWKQKTHKPLAIVLVSQGTAGMAVIRVSSSDRWTARRRFDNVRRIEDTFYEVRRSDLATFDEFVVWLRARDARYREAELDV